MAIHGEWGEGAALTFAGDATRPWAEIENFELRGISEEIRLNRDFRPSKKNNAPTWGAPSCHVFDMVP